METQTNPPTNSGRTGAGAKDFFINLGAIVALYTLVISLINLLFTVINKAFPQITNGYNYGGSASVSWPVAILIIVFPIFILLMWLLERDYAREPERKNKGVHKWLTYITLFISGAALAGDLIAVLYYFIDGQELTKGFLLKILVVLVIAGALFTYYISEIRGKLTSKSRKIWRVIAGAIILASIIWGFSVLGSPRTQRLLKYDEEKVSDLQNINNYIINFYEIQHSLPASLAETKDVLNMDYSIIPTDPQTQQPYTYQKKGDTAYELCAKFNRASAEVQDPNIYMRPIGYGYQSWVHPAGEHCFSETVNPNMYINQMSEPPILPIK